MLEEYEERKKVELTPGSALVPLIPQDMSHAVSVYVDLLVAGAPGFHLGVLVQALVRPGGGGRRGCSEESGYIAD